MKRLKSFVDFILQKYIKKFLYISVHANIIRTNNGEQILYSIVREWLMINYGRFIW